MWISKDGDVRKKELLDAALALFEEKGYEKTTIDDIIGKVGVTKGAFYYYFKSKEEILNAVAEQQAEGLLAVAGEAAADASLNALEKLNGIAAKAMEAKAKSMQQRMAAYKALKSENGILLGMRTLEKTVEKGGPVICSIIEQGVRENLFDTPSPQEAASLYIHLSSHYSSEAANMLLNASGTPGIREALREKFLFYEDVIVRLLGIRQGRVELAEHAMKYL